MRAAICDDEKSMQMVLEKMLNEYSRLRSLDISTDKFSNGRDLLRVLNEKEYIDIPNKACQNIEDVI